MAVGWMQTMKRAQKELGWVAVSKAVGIANEMKMDASCPRCSAGDNTLPLPSPLPCLAFLLAMCNLNMPKADRPKSGWWKHGGERERCDSPIALGTRDG